MSRMSAFAGAVLLFAATVLGAVSEAQAKKGGGGRGGGGGGIGKAVGHGKFKAGGGKHQFRAHGFSRHGRAAARGPRHFARPAMRGRAARAGWRDRFTTGRGAGAKLERGLAQPSARARFHAAGVRSFAARPALRGAAWPGPFFYSYATDDVFWPTAYDRVFWGYGAPDILAGVLAPGYDAPVRRESRRGSRADRALARGQELPGGLGVCDDQPPRVTNIAAVEQEVRPTAEQRPAFAELQAAEAKAVDVMRAACPSDLPPSPTGRLDAMVHWVDALHEAVQIVTPPLEKFYGALDDEQKARFAVLVSAGGQADRQWLEECADQPRAVAAVPTDRVARTLKLSQSQLTALEDVSAASDQAAGRIRESCPRETPLTPTGRLAAIAQRLAALRDTLDAMRPPLEAFYGALTDEQKAYFERIGTRRRAG